MACDQLVLAISERTMRLRSDDATLVLHCTPCNRSLGLACKDQCFVVVKKGWRLLSNFSLTVDECDRYYPSEDLMKTFKLWSFLQVAISKQVGFDGLQY